MKFRISWLWLPFGILIFHSDMIKTMAFLCLMLSLHEGAHMLVATFFHYPIESVTIYPFGVCAQMKYIGMGNVWKEFLIIAAGPCTHLIFPWLFSLLQNFGVISTSYMEYLCMLNTSILVFNLLPVFPLDGGRMMQSLYHLALPYTWAQRLTMASSILHLFLLFYYDILTTWSAYVVMGFLLMQILIAWKQITFDRLQFYHYRKNHPVSYPIHAHHHKDLYRAYTNMIATQKGWIMEDEWLQYYFHDSTLPHRHTIIL